MATHISIGKQKRVAVVLSCPGRYEEKARRPAAKTTGKNLDMLLIMLGSLLKRKDLIRKNITITNAWPKVEYKAKTGRSEASDQEIKGSHNIKRVQRELNDISDFVIFCGEKAKTVSQFLRLNKSPKFIYVEHLAIRGLSSIKIDAYGNPIVAASGTGKIKKAIQAENTKKRLNVVAINLLNQLKALVKPRCVSNCVYGCNKFRFRLKPNRR
ncbi:hypothetical protein [Methylovulum sp.]|uniref:hypothetical protein n=1 Tax=Methylovulum sp. TaxID=1916980 RepID=UPI00261ADE0D|nr:hypothetical protein [Methylovulum sp.]MDD5125819.1 hypothetical protein [Methylovulum sp.]